MRKLKCPAGHTLPHKEGRRECTPLKCGASTGPAKRLRAAPKALPKKPHPEGEEGVIDDPSIVPTQRKDGVGTGPLVDDEETFMVEARKARERLVPTFVLKEGEDPVDATLAHTARLLPSAAQQVEFQLLFGDSKARFEAALAVFDQHGIRKKESVVGGGNTIILNVSGGGGLTLPWKQGARDAVVSQGAVGAPAQRQVDAGAHGVGGLLPTTGEREVLGSQEVEPDAGGPLDE